MSQIPQLDPIAALIDVNNDLRRELDAANKTIKELYDENDRLMLKVLNSKAKVMA
jgi:hypothetical protein